MSAHSLEFVLNSRTIHVLLPYLTVTIQAFTAETFSKHIQVLASDEFEGRRPATAGEE